MEQNKLDKDVEIKEIIGMRNHISSVLEQMWGVLLVLFFIFIQNEEMLSLAITFVRDGNILKALVAMGIFFLVFIIVIAFYLNLWYKTTITVKDGMVVIERRTLNRSVNSIAVQNISNINLEQNLFEMLMGTYKLKLDTSSLTTAESTDVKIVLSKRNANLVKNLIMSMMKEQELSDRQQELYGAVEAGELTEEEAKKQFFEEKDYLREDEERNYDVIYDIKDILINCLLNTSLLLLAISIGFLVTTVIFMIHTFGSGVSIVSGLAGFVVQLILAGSFISALFKQWLDDFNFRAMRDRDKIYVSTGLIKKRKYAVPVNKINAVCFQQTLLSRLFHRSYVKVINIGGEDRDVDGMKLLLMGTQQQLKERLSILLPEYPFPEHNALQRQPGRILIKGLAKSVVFMLFVLLLYYVGTSFLLEGQAGQYHSICFFLSLAVVVLFGLLVAGCILQYITTGLSYTSHYLMISRGMFGKTVVTIPYKKMQYITIRQNLMNRLLGVKKLQIKILASLASREQGSGCYFSKDYDEIIGYFQRSYRERAD